MIGYLEALNVMHTRSITIDEKDYLFTLMVVLDEEPQKAYALAYDLPEFKKHIGTEEEDEYLASKKKDADAMLEKQDIMQLKDLLAESLRTQIQAAALNLENYTFTGQEAVQILNNLLKTRMDDLESASVRDVVGIIKMLTEQGALETGDGGFSRHFVVVHPKFNALCVCGREFECHAGVGVKCPHCGQVYEWSESEQRFFPEPNHL